MEMRMNLPAILKAWVLVGLGLVTWSFAAGCGQVDRPSDPSPVSSQSSADESGEASADQVHRFCGYCHAYPPPDTFPRSAWRMETLRGYRFFDQLLLDKPSLHIPGGVPPTETV